MENHFSGFGIEKFNFIRNSGYLMNFEYRSMQSGKLIRYFIATHFISFVQILCGKTVFYEITSIFCPRIAIFVSTLHFWIVVYVIKCWPILTIYQTNIFQTIDLLSALCCEAAPHLNKCEYI